MSPWILTYSGKRLDLLNPQPEQICIEDIAHALSQQCRYTGHTKHFYSVAQHCIHMSDLIAKDFQFLALLHDAAEAYVSDMNAPLKYHIDERYRTIEAAIEDVIFAKYNLNRDEYPVVKAADLRMLATERLWLFPAHDDEWEVLQGVEPYPIRIDHWAPCYAKKEFLKRFNKLVTL
jgi:5'-deoxynucleotidase YfbR-like HD superfamily hydrolase